MDTNSKKPRIVNGYRIIYLPDHPKAMTSSNWNGWVYEHIVVAEQKKGRPLGDNEVVHHLDFDRSNNRSENLLIIDRGEHSKLHAWLDKGAPGWKQPGENRMNSGKPKVCETCGSSLQAKQKKYCSPRCTIGTSRKVVRPPMDILLKEIEDTSYSAVGRKYGVSDNAIRKWIKPRQS